MDLLLGLGILVIVVGVIVLKFWRLFELLGIIPQDRTEEQLGIKTVKTRNDVCLVASIPLRMNLVLSKSNSWTRVLGGTPLFRQPKSGDVDFDQTFSITAYRDDVMWVIQKNAELRRTLIQLAKVMPAFASLSYTNEKLSLSLRPGAFSKGDALESARATLAAIVPSLVTPFEKLPSDTVQQVRARSLDVWLPNLPIITLVILAIVGPSYDQPLASGEFPWKFVMLGGVLFAALHIALLFSLTKQGAARMRGVLVAFVASILCTYTTMPALVRGINAWSQQRLVTEPVEVAGLYEVTPTRGAHHYYVLLSTAPSQLAAGNQGAAISLEISSDLYYSLGNQGVRQGSQLEIAEATGLLGLPFVVQATPL